MNVYEINPISKQIEGNPYVGRGIIAGLSTDGKRAVAAYFIMGRSENSRNRVFKTRQDGTVFTAPYDPSKCKDPSLIIYNAVRAYEDTLIVTNGNQTDTIYDFLIKGESIEAALETREFEPDAPNLTPRISAALINSNGKLSYKLNICKSIDEAGSACARFNFAYPAKAGLGHFIHTYITDGNPLPSFTGEPERIAIPDSIDEFMDEIWQSLDNDNRISLYVSYTDLESKVTVAKIINAHEA